MIAALNILKKVLPFGIAALGANKSKLLNFIKEASVSGYGTAEIIGFLKSQLSSSGQQASRASLEERVQSGAARPDERAALSEITRRERPQKILETMIPFAAGAFLPGLFSGAKKPTPAPSKTAQIISQPTKQIPYSPTQRAETVLETEGSILPESIRSKTFTEAVRETALAQRQKGPTSPTKPRMPTQKEGQMTFFGEEEAPESIQVKEPVKTPVMKPEKIKGEQPDLFAGETALRTSSVIAGADEFFRQHPKIAKFFRTGMEKGLPVSKLAKQAKAKPFLKAEIAQVEQKNDAPFEDVVEYLFQTAKASNVAMPSVKQAPDARMTELGEILKSLRKR